MTRTTLASTAILAAVLVPLLHAAPAHAQLTQTWVSGIGLDHNFCRSGDPCATFQRAHDMTAPGGEIICADAGEFGSVRITKSISITCDNGVAAITKTSGSVAINIEAGANDIITLKGLDLDGGGAAALGISVIQAAAVHVHKVQIRNFRQNSAGTGGILFQPIGYAELYVLDSFITDNGWGTRADSAGILVMPAGTNASANVFINRVRLENNSFGILINGSSTTGVAVNATVVDSVIAGSAGHGIAAVASPGTAAASIFLDHSVVSGNFASGINANGVAASGAGSAMVRVGDSTIVLNVNGVSMTGAGVVQSMKNNRISSNLSDGTPVPAFPGPGGTPLQ